MCLFKESMLLKAEMLVVLATKQYIRTQCGWFRHIVDITNSGHLSDERRLEMIRDMAEHSSVVPKWAMRE